MRGVFRITKAEFIKIFKKPTVYIMAFILMLTCVLSLFLYSPTSRPDLTVKLADENAITNYNIFMSDTGSDNKNAYDDTITETNKKVDYVINLSNRYNDYYNSMNALILELENNENFNKITIINHLNHIIGYYSEDYDLNDVEYFKYFTTLKDTNNEVYYTYDLEQLRAIKDKIELLPSTENIKEYVTSENIIVELQAIYKNYVNYAPIILNAIVDEIEETHSSFITAIQQNSSQQSTQLTTLQITKLKNIYTLLKNYNDAINHLLETDYPIALMSKKDYENYQITFTRVEKIVKLTDAEINKYSVRLTCAEQLSQYDYISKLKATNNSINYINVVNKEFVKELTDPT